MRKIRLITILMMLCSSLAIFCIGFASWNIFMLDFPADSGGHSGSFESYDAHLCVAEITDNLSYTINGFDAEKNVIKVKYTVSAEYASSSDEAKIEATLKYLGASGKFLTDANIDVSVSGGGSLRSVTYNGNSLVTVLTVTGTESADYIEITVNYAFSDLKKGDFWNTFGQYFLLNDEFVASAVFCE